MQTSLNTYEQSTEFSFLKKPNFVKTFFNLKALTATSCVIFCSLFLIFCTSESFFTRLYPEPSYSQKKDGFGAGKNSGNTDYFYGIDIDFKPDTILGGQAYPPEKLKRLIAHFEKNGTDVVCTFNQKQAWFQARNPETGRPTLGFPPRPTVLQVRHELSHWLDCKTLGVDKYAKLSEYHKEQMVLDRLKQNRIWSNGVTNRSERDFSKKYVKKKYEEYMRNIGK